jgi:gelsolin
LSNKRNITLSPFVSHCSNIAGIGSEENRDLRKAAAASDKQFKGAGQKAGLEVWRVENTRSKSDTPVFGVKRWPKEEYGQFFTGDSYLVLNTYQVVDPATNRKTDKLAWDVHFWLGDKSTQDEYGVAAYKAVELDDLLDDGPVQHREVCGHESRLFQSYWSSMSYNEGGIASGFRKVKPEEYEPRLMQVRRTKKTVRAFECPVKASSLNKGDVFILDAGLTVYVYIGESANAFEKSKGGALAHNILASRQGKAKKAEPDSAFWKILGGSAKDVKEAEEKAPLADDAADPEQAKLFKVSDATGSMKFTKVAEGKLESSMLDSNDAFIVDAANEIFVWVGARASRAEKLASITQAEKYLASSGKPIHLPITRIMEGQVNSVFASCFKH